MHPIEQLYSSNVCVLLYMIVKTWERKTQICSESYLNIFTEGYMHREVKHRQNTVITEKNFTSEKSVWSGYKAAYSTTLNFE